MSYLDVFIMPKQASIAKRTSTITNSFVNGVIPCIMPTEKEVAEALAVLEMDNNSIACAYCGDPFTEWDHLNPLVKNKQQTGYISEIHNLVPSCSKCNQSKGNKPWHDWMTGNAAKSPASRNIEDLHLRIERLKRYEQKFTPLRLEFEAIVGSETWNQYWQNCETLHDMFHEFQLLSDDIKAKIVRYLNDVEAASPSREKTLSVQEQPVQQHADFSSDLLPDELEGIETATNKSFVMRCLAYLETNSKTPEADVAILTDPLLSKKEIGQDYAILKPTTSIDKAGKEERMIGGYERYYCDVITLWGKRYIVSKEWYGLGKVNKSNNRNPFLAWVLSHS